MANPTDRQYDSLLLLKASAAVTASAAGSLILDLGDARTEGQVIIDVSALKIAANDEAYSIVVQGSPDSDFGTAANVVELCSLHLGASETKTTDSDKDDTTGRYLLRFTNERAGTFFRYLRLYTWVDSGGTSPSITYSAFATID